MTAAVLAEDLVFDYPGVRALNHVSFAVEAASITALVGPNGAGKTTLLRCLAALEEPFSGRIFVDGLDVQEHPRESHRRIGYLSDSFGVYDELTVERCLRYRAAAQAVPPAEVPRLVQRAAERLGIADRLQQTAGTLSRGLRQRLAIAQAIIHEPRLVLLDEPASGLDPEARRSLAAVLRELRDDGMTIIVSSHILTELEDYSTHLLILRDGRIVDYRALDAGDGDSRAIVAVRLAAADPRLEPLLAAGEGISDLVVNGAAATFRCQNTPVAQARVLRALVQAGLQVAAFGAETASLEEVYLARARDGGA